jgi:8-oxo-dGTP diphosphatase
VEDRTPVANVEGAVVRDGEYLPVERAADEAHASGLLAFPGGRVEPPPDGDASIEATARRELAAEVGLEVGTVEYVHGRTFVTDDGTGRPNVLTLCGCEAGGAPARDPAEVAAVGRYAPEGVGDHPDVPGSSNGTSSGSRRAGASAAAERTGRSERARRPSTAADRGRAGPRIRDGTGRHGREGTGPSRSFLT